MNGWYCDRSLDGGECYGGLSEAWWSAGVDGWKCKHEGCGYYLCRECILVDKMVKI
jgi:hypothetical protein